MSYLEDLFSVSGKTALITGAASGIGRMAATALVKGGARVMIASRRAAECEKVAEELNAMGASGTAEGFGGDVGSEAGVMELVDAVKARTDSLHILAMSLTSKSGSSDCEAVWANSMGWRRPTVRLCSTGV